MPESKIKVLLSESGEDEENVLDNLINDEIGMIRYSNNFISNITYKRLFYYRFMEE